MLKFKFWYTDLSEDSGQPWFATHLRIWGYGRGKSASWARTSSTMFGWKLLLILKALSAPSQK